MLGKNIFDEIRREHKQQPVPPNSDLKEKFERTTADITQALSLLHENGKRTDAEIQGIKAKAVEEFKRNNAEITQKIEAQLEEREKKFQEQMAEFQRSKAIADKEAVKETFRRSLQDFLKTGKVPENAQSTENFSRNIQVNNPTSAGFAISPVELLGIQEQPAFISDLHTMVKRLSVNARSGALSLKKARRVDSSTVPFLVEGQEATKQYELNMSETQFQTQAIAMIFNLSRQFLEMAINPEDMIARDVDDAMTETANNKILFGDTDGNIGPGGIYNEMQVSEAPNKFKAYNSATSNTITLTDLQQFYGNKRIWAYRGKSRWYMSTDALAKLRFQTGSDGHFDWTQDIREGFPQLLNGQQVIPVAEMPGIATGNIPVLYGDMESAYALVEFAGSHMIRDEVTLAASRMVKFVFFRYLDGKPVDTDALVGLRVA